MSRTRKRDAQYEPVRTPLEVVPALKPDTPPADRGWLKATKDAWESYWGSDVASVVDAASDLPSVRRLFSLMDERERAARSVRKNPLVTGSQGQPVLNPLARWMSVLDGEIRALEDRLGANPKARYALGIAVTEAHKSLDALNAQWQQSQMESDG